MNHCIVRVRVRVRVRVSYPNLNPNPNPNPNPDLHRVGREDEELLDARRDGGALEESEQRVARALG